MISKKMNYLFGLTIISIVILAVVAFVYFSAHTTCCSEDISENQLQQTLNNAANGNLSAMKLLFYYYDNRREDGGAAKAEYWLKRAADEGDAESAFLFYGFLERHEDAMSRASAAKYLYLAAEHGSPIAQRILGKSYRDGAGVPRNLDLAESWLRKSAQAGENEGVLAFCDLALAGSDSQKLRECEKMDALALIKLDEQSALALDLSHQRERIASKLKQHN